jgi:hypothetical protein
VLCRSADALVSADIYNRGLDRIARWTAIEYHALKISVLRILRSLGTKVGAGDGCCVLPSFSCQLSIVKTAGVAQGASSIRAPAPFGRLGSVTAVTSAWGSSALETGSVVVLQDLIRMNAYTSAFLGLGTGKSASF